MTSAPDRPPLSRRRFPRRFARSVLTAALAAAALGFASSAASGQELSLLRKLVQQQILAELASHDSQDNAYYNEKSVNRESWTNCKLLGKKIRLASWTEQSKTWLWFEDPASTVAVELTQLAVVDGRLEFALRAEIRQARFKAWGRIPKLAKAAVGGAVHAELLVAGSTAIAGGGLAGSQITTFQGRLIDLRFNNDAAHPLEDLAKDGVNDYINDKNEKLRRSIEKALDRVQFSKSAPKTEPAAPAVVGG